MAASKELASDIKQHLLKCKICLNKIKLPRSLPCLHSYCTNCLDTLSGGGTFRCPECRALTTPRRRSVYNFPVAFHLNYLAETIQLHDSSSSSIPCCNKEDDDLHDNAAVKCIECNAYYCNICDNHHNTIIVAKNHISVKIEELNQDHLMKSAQKKVSFCDIHKDSPLRYFCIDESCNTPICQDCNAVKHKTHQVIELDTKATELRTENAKIISEDMQKAEEDLLRAQKSIQIAIKEIEKQGKENEEKIKERTQQMLKKVNEDEKVLLERARKTQDEFNAGFEQLQKEVDEKLASLQESKAMFENMNNFSPDDEIARQNKEIRKKTQTALEEATVPDIKVHTVYVVSKDDPVVDRKQEFKEGREYSVLKALDGPICSIAELENATFAIRWHYDEWKSKVFVKSSSTSQEKELKRKIEGHCRNANRVVAMNEGGKEKIVFCNNLDVPFGIKILHIEEAEIEDQAIGDMVRPFAIAVDEDNNILFTMPHTINKITKNGIQTLFKDQDEDEVMSSPWYITTNTNGDIVVSDDIEKSLIIFNKKGEIINTYKEFKHSPQGICTDPDGNIYVSDVGGHCIHCLDRTGKFQNYAVTKEDGLKSPLALAFHKGKLVVGQGNGEIKYFNIQNNKMRTAVKRGQKRIYTGEAGPSGKMKKFKK